MEGTILDRETAAPRASGLRFRLATEQDDAAIRRLLRANPLRGGVSLTVEHEPNYFQGTGVAGAEERTILAWEGERLVCMGRCSIQTRYVNGRPLRVGYLGELRLDGAARGRFDILRRGHQFFREVYRHDNPALWFTSIPADNQASLRFLERGLPGMPRYTLLTAFVTRLIPVSKHQPAWRTSEKWRTGGLRCVPGTRSLASTIASCLNDSAARAQLATQWTPEQVLKLERWGLRLPDISVVMKGEKAVACSALWDQRMFRQTRIRGYSGGVALARPWINVVSTISGTPGMPAAGSVLAHAFLSPLAVDPAHEELRFHLVETSIAQARLRGVEFLTLGFAANDPAARKLGRCFGARDYRSRLYRVSWPDEPVGEPLDGRPFAPEVALL